MAGAREAKDWARSELDRPLIGDSLSTPFRGRDGEERRGSIAPATIIQSCTSSMTVQDVLELTQHAQAAGSDICFLQTPMMEAHGGAGLAA